MSLVFSVNVKKTALRKIHPDLIVQQLEQFSGRILKEGRTKKGWRMHWLTASEEAIKVDTTEKTEEGVEVPVTKDGFAYNVVGYVTCRSKGKRLDAIVTKEFEEILKILEKTSRSKSWSVVSSARMDADFSYPGPDEPVCEETVDETPEVVNTEPVVEPVVS
jgi:hypothetical protein